MSGGASEKLGDAEEGAGLIHNGQAETVKF